MQEIIGENNHIIAPQNLKCDISIYGNNNNIIFDETSNLTGMCIIYGSNTEVRVGRQTKGNVIIKIGGDDMRKTDEAKLIIGDNVHFGSVAFQLMEKGSKIEVGNRSIFARGIQIFCSDTHSVIDLEGNLLNAGKYVEIGEHVWVGTDVKIGKNTKIPKDSIVGWGSVVTHCFQEPNVVIAGNPAKVVKKGINWDGKHPDLYAERNKNGK